MSPRVHVFVPGLTAVAGTLLIGVALYLRPAAPQPVAPPAPPRNSLVPAKPRPSAFAWQLVGASSYGGAMVLEVETTRPSEGVAIAQQLTEPYKKDFDEVLVYIFEPNAQPRLAVRRVQWTRRGGYKTMELRQ